MIFGKLLLASAMLGGAEHSQAEQQARVVVRLNEEDREEQIRAYYEYESRRLAAQIDADSLLLGQYEHAQEMKANPPLTLGEYVQMEAALNGGRRGGYAGYSSASPGINAMWGGR